ncbi:MAG TPA: hypothetical protein PKM19_08570, partial [Pseudomonadales bacterium]|nr:hypothetical protein [Pseudomonadales bacterium]
MVLLVEHLPVVDAGPGVLGVVFLSSVQRLDAAREYITLDPTGAAGAHRPPQAASTSAAWPLTFTLRQMRASR